MGPYSIILGKILQNWAAESRKDVKPFGFSNQAKLFRGDQLPDEQIENLKNYKTPIRIIGNVSTSLDKSVAIKSSFKNGLAPGYQNVLYVIKWDYPRCHYIMDIGAFPFEREVLLYDGTQLEISSVSQKEDSYGIKFTQVVLDTNVINF